MIHSRLFLSGMIVTVLSVLSACETPERTPYAQYLAEKERSDAAIEALRGMNGRLEMHDPGATVSLRDLSDREARTAFPLLHDVMLLDGLRLRRVELTRRNARALEGLHLRHLTVAESPLTPETLPAIFRVEGLREARLIDTGAGDAAVDHLRRFEDLHSLTLAYEPVTDEGLAQVAELPRLRTLRLVAADVSEEAMQSLVEANTRLVIEVGDERIIRGVDATR